MRSKFLMNGIILVLFFLSGILSINVKGGSDMQSIKSKKVVMIIASNNFRDEELLKPKEVLERNGVAVTVASSSLKESTGMLGAKVKPDILFININVADYNAVIFVGGSVPPKTGNNPPAQKIPKEPFSPKKIVGAICIAPVTLAKAGLLKDKKATTYSSTVNDLKSAGAKYTGADVEKDGNIITASGPAVAQKFGETILKALGQ